MLVSKNIQIDFANSSMKAIDAILDIKEGPESVKFIIYESNISL